MRIFCLLLSRFSPQASEQTQSYRGVTGSTGEHTWVASEQWAGVFSSLDEKSSLWIRAKKKYSSC